MTISRRKFLAVVLLFSSAFAWFYIFYNHFNELGLAGVISESIWYDAGIITFLISTVVFAFIGSSIANRVKRRKFLAYWILFGILVIIPIMFIRIEEFLVVFGLLGGLSFGLGFPLCQAVIADSTTPEERGRVAGVVIFISFILLMFSIVIIQALGLTPSGIILFSIAIKSIGFIAILLDPFERKIEKAQSWQKVLHAKDFDYYLLAFVMFSISAGLVGLIWNQLYNLTPIYEEFNRIGTSLRYVGLSVFALIAGVMADRIGRKKPILMGLIMLGAAYAIVGALTTPETYLVNLILSGLAWGVIFVVYLVVPGDLSHSGSSERYYALGWLLPVILIIGIEGSGRLIGYAPPITIFSTVLIIIILVAFVPIIYAAETLSESKIRRRRFKDYTERVGKIIQESKE
jgi:MFS family permease